MTFDLRAQGGQNRGQKLTSTDLPNIWYVRPVSDSKPFQPSTFDLEVHWRSKVKLLILLLASQVKLT